MRPVSPRRRASIRLWQTELFVVVIVVAMLILSGALSAGLKDTLSEMAMITEVRNASAMVQRLEMRLPITSDDLGAVRRDIDEYRGIYGTGIWVYTREGELLESSSDGSPGDEVLHAAWQEGLRARPSYASIDMSRGGWVVAAKPLVGTSGSLFGVVVTASPVDASLAILDAVRYRLWVTFWISLIVAGLLGFAFSEFIGRRIRAMSEAAAAMAAGDFEQRLPTGFVPDEVYDLAVSYNSMASKLGEAFAALQESERAQRRFVADASHEMRTPIAALKGILELLADGAQDDPEVREDFIRTMGVETDRLGRLVGDLLTLAQLEAGEITLDVAPQWAADVLGDVARVMHALAERAGVVLAVDLPDGDLRFMGDRDRVVQVLLSFTDNALKHSARESRIRLRARRSGDTVTLEVSDEGEGIAADELPRVFERFYRSDSARAGSGAGLGLAIAKEIVEAHGSMIDVRSAPGEGATFGFALPSADVTDAEPAASDAGRAPGMLTEP